MANKFSKPGRSGGNNQRSQNKHKSTSQKLSREQLIFRLETLREELEENPNLDAKRKARIEEDMLNYNTQLSRF